MRIISIMLVIIVGAVVCWGAPLAAADPEDPTQNEDCVKVTETPLAQPAPLLGEPDNPIPLLYRYQVPNARGKLEIQTLAVNYDALGQLRGSTYNPNNFSPKPGNKYVLARFRVTNKGVWGEHAWVWRGDFGAVTSDGRTLTPAGVFVHDRMYFDLKGGDIGEGEVVFETPISEDNLLLFYAPDYLRLERTYFATR